ncbi:cardioactive peptide [Chrysoperla carnea]|uniref:cardioactive peptide n=1 Tax=Chrysoperla carnea TaxID=189513 RepID=UPI001D05E25D|nr:cardioactive peptide [Chrysoperla carnea]
MKGFLILSWTLLIVTFVVLSTDKSVFGETRVKRAAFIGRGPQLDPKKRPFCNAFTGCGRKRSEIPSADQTPNLHDESISSLLDLSAEPAVEDLSRQIMSEAKLWEAIQEANQEILRRKQENADIGNNLVGLGNGGGRCGLGGNCFIQN